MAGWFLVGLGIVGLFVPVLQGVLLIALGLIVLSRHSAPVRRLVERLRRRFPWLDRAMRRVSRRKGSEMAHEEGPGEPSPPGHESGPSAGQSTGTAGTKIGSPEASSTTEP